MRFVDRFFGLRRQAPFDKLADSDLEVIAHVAARRIFKPGEVVCPKGRPVRRLIIVTSGRCESAGAPLPAVIGVEGLLFDTPTLEPIVASPATGAWALVLSRSHFFTVVYECPDLLIGLLQREAVS